VLAVSLGKRSAGFGLLGYYGQQAFKRLSTPVDIAPGECEISPFETRRAAVKTVACATERARRDDDA